MKKSTLFLLLLMLSISLFSNTMFANIEHLSNLPVSSPSEVPAHVQVQLDRLKEIKAMDKSDMTSSEKKHFEKK